MYNWEDGLRYVWPVLPYFVAPILVALLVCRGTWKEIGFAYAIWIGLLAFLGFLMGGARNDGYSWMLILAIFTTVIAIPVLVLLLKLWRYLKTRKAIPRNSE